MLGCLPHTCCCWPGRYTTSILRQRPTAGSLGSLEPLQAAAGWSPVPGCVVAAAHQSRGLDIYCFNTTILYCSTMCHAYNSIHGCIIYWSQCRRNAPGLDMDWAPHAAALAARGRRVTWATLGPRSFWAMPGTDPLYATADFAALWADATAVDITYDNDYLVPLLLSNRNYGAFFERHFPGRQVFHRLAAFLFQLAPRHAAAAEAFRAASFGSPGEAFVVGVQIRTHKAHGGLRAPPLAYYCSLARALALRRGLPAGQVRTRAAAEVALPVAVT